MFFKPLFSEVSITAGLMAFFTWNDLYLYLGILQDWQHFPYEWTEGQNTIFAMIMVISAKGITDFVL